MIGKKVPKWFKMKNLKKNRMSRNEGHATIHNGQSKRLLDHCYGWMNLNETSNYKAMLKCGYIF